MSPTINELNSTSAPHLAGAKPKLMHLLVGRIREQLWQLPQHLASCLPQPYQVVINPPALYICFHDCGLFLGCFIK